jgi:mRNA-degrading endonuclease RelE of RelBE toxin-antitoxin system
MSLGSFEIRITHRAAKDIKTLSPKLKKKLYDILTEVIALNPYEGKKLLGDLAGSYSYRLSYQDRIVYSIDREKQIVYIERARTHYGD